MKELAMQGNILYTHTTVNYSFIFPTFFFAAFVEGNAAMSAVQYFENHILYFVQNRMKLLAHLSTKCSWCAIVIVLCPLCGVRRPSSTFTLCML